MMVLVYMTTASVVKSLAPGIKGQVFSVHSIYGCSLEVKLVSGVYLLDMVVHPDGGGH